ncbi:MAG TPA: SPOR domain-containing protein [Steroidobacteraceae bacterium]|jgi:cell division protein FtsN
MPKLNTRDYKKSHRRTARLGRSREFAVGAFFGVALGAAAVYYVSAHHGMAHERIQGPRPEPQRPAPADPEATATPASHEKYDFYEMLPNFEVVVPEKDKEVKRDLPAAAPVERPGVYVLQAGSYRNESDADRVRAQLAMQGIDAKVQRVAVDADVWHRVRIGPITRLDELNRLRKQLQAADVDALVIRVGD